MTVDSNRKAVLFVYSGGVKDVLLNEKARDNCTEPYLRLKKKIELLGYTFDWELKHDIEAYESIAFLDIESIGRTETCRVLARRIKNYFVYGDAYNIYEKAIRKKLQDRMLLIISEPLHKENFIPKKHKKFNKILTWHDGQVDSKKYFKYYLPITSVYPEIDQIPFSSKKIAVNISYNKSSTHPMELYSRRRSTIKCFENKFGEQFDLFGYGWNNEGDYKFKSYKGPVQHKWDVLPGYRYVLCYENVVGFPGYISEKIFDAIRCKTVPIYWGDLEIDKYVPDKVLIDRSKFSCDEELADYLASLSIEEYQYYISNGAKFMASDKVSPFLSENFADTIIKAMNLS